jgi:Ferritin-like
MTVRGFADPLLELIRLLRTAADIEHAALLQYTYSAFSLKSGYESVGGFHSDNSMSLMTIAIENMMRFGAANRMLVVLGASPRLLPPSFPLGNGDSLPTFNLEPLSREALAAYIYRDAPQRIFGIADSDRPDGQIAADICKVLGAPPRRAAGIYTAIADAAGAVGRLPGVDLPDLTRWTDALQVLDNGGREGRFEFLKQLFLGSHPAFAGHSDVWRLSRTDDRYPSYEIIRSPAAYAGRPNQRPDPTTVGLARLGDLQYGTTLLLLDLYFRHHLAIYRSLAVTHMMGPVRSVGRHLPRLGAGMPFEAINAPDSSALDAKHRLRFILALLQEGQTFAEAIESRLPPDYPLSVNRDAMAQLRELDTRNEAGPTRSQ